MSENNIPPGYLKQLEEMAQKAREWRANNPRKDAKVQFNIPSGVALIACISDAIKNKLSHRAKALQALKSALMT